MAAGQGFKTFATGDVLSAADVNGYLMQGVLVFADSAERDAEITSPEEGQYAYLKDTNVTYYYSGSTWVSTAGAASPLTTKGDLYTFDTADARLAVGANGETLVADSSTSTGLRYTAGNPIPNPIINSAMQVWQRTTSLAATTSLGTYAADRWMVRRTSTAANTFSRQLTSDTTNLPNIQYCMRVQRTAGDSAASLLILEYSQETVNSIPYAGKTVTMSFYARAGANFSATSNALTARLKTGTGTDQNIGATYTGEATPIGATATLTTTWQRFTYTATLSTSATEMGLQFFYTTTGTAGAADYYEITGFQIDIGSVALPFRTYAGTIQGELAACQRYYFRTGLGRQNVGHVKSSTTAGLITFFPVTMRNVPSALEQSGTASDYLVVFGPYAAACSSVPTFETGSTNNATSVFTVASGLTTGDGIIGGSNSANSYLAWSAEL